MKKVVYYIIGVIFIVFLTVSYYHTHQHRYKDISYIASTCTQEGSKVSKCWCGDVQIESLPMLAHEYEEIEETSTCTKDGKQIYKCKNCGYTHEETIKAVGHRFEEEILKEPTCLEAGKKKFTCKKCGFSYTEEIEPTVHIYEETIVEPTCDKSGEVIYKCKHCKDTHKHTLAPLGHDIKKDKCTRCGKTQVEITGLNKDVTELFITDANIPVGVIDSGIDINSIVTPTEISIDNNTDTLGDTTNETDDTMVNEIETTDASVAPAIEVPNIEILTNNVENK